MKNKADRSKVITAKLARQYFRSPLSYLRQLPSIVAIFIVTLVGLQGCSGGGGGDVDAGTGARVLHAAVDLYPIDVTADTVENKILQTSRFAFATKYFGLDQGDHVISLTQSGTGAGLFSMPLSVTGGQRQSIVVVGLRESGTLAFNVYNDEPGDIPEGLCAVRLINGISRTSSISGAIGTETISGVAFNSSSGYSYIAPGSVRVTLTAGGRTLFSGQRTLETGKAYTLLGGGEVDYLVVVPLYEDR